MAFEPVEQLLAHQVFLHGLAQAGRIDAAALADAAGELLDLGFELLLGQFDRFGQGQGLEGQAAAQALFGFGPGGVPQAAHQFGGEQLAHVHALLGQLAGGLLQQGADLFLHQGFGQFHLELLHQGVEQGVVAVGLVAPVGVLLEAGFQVGAQLGQGFLVAGLLGEGVVELGQLLGLEVGEGEHEAGRPAAAVLLGVLLGELAGHGLGVAHRHADHPFDEAGDHAALFQFHVHAFATAAADRAGVIVEGAAEVDHGHIAGQGAPALDRHQAGQLLAGLLNPFIDPGGVVADGFAGGHQPLGEFQAGGGFHIQLQDQGELLAGGKALQQGLETTGQFRLADGRDRFLGQGVAEHGIDQLFQGRGAHPQGADLLQQHRLGHLPLAEARQLDAAAQFRQGCVVAGLATARRNGDFQGQAAARARAGGDLQAGGGGGAGG